MIYATNVSLSLMVLRALNPEQSKQWYENFLGVRFTKEKHGGGYEHYSVILKNNVVMEIYPTAERTDPKGIRAERIGFWVDHLETVIDCLEIMGERVGPIREDILSRSVTAIDPDGRTVEIRQLKP